MSKLSKIRNTLAVGTVATAMSVAPSMQGCAYHEDCTLSTTDTQATKVAPSPISEGDCINDLRAVCDENKFAVCAVIGDGMNDTTEKQIEPCSDPDDICIGKDVSACFITQNPDSVTLTCSEE